MTPKIESNFKIVRTGEIILVFRKKHIYPDPYLLIDVTYETFEPRNVQLFSLSSICNFGEIMKCNNKNGIDIEYLTDMFLKNCERPEMVIKIIKYHRRLNFIIRDICQIVAWYYYDDPGTVDTQYISKT